MRDFYDKLAAEHQIAFFPKYSIASKIRDKIARAVALSSLRLPTSIGYVPPKLNNGSPIWDATWKDIFNEHREEIKRLAESSELLREYPKAKDLCTDDYMLAHGLVGKKPDNSSGKNIIFLRPQNDAGTTPQSVIHISKVTATAFHGEVIPTPRQFLEKLGLEIVTYLFEPCVERKHLKDVEWRVVFGWKPNDKHADVVPQLIYVSQTKHTENNAFDMGQPTAPSLLGERFKEKSYKLYNSVVQSYWKETGLTASDFKHSVIRIDCFHLQDDKNWQEFNEKPEPTGRGKKAPKKDPNSDDYPFYPCLLLNEAESVSETCMFLRDLGSEYPYLFDIAGNIKFASLEICEKKAQKPSGLIYKKKK